MPAVFEIMLARPGRDDDLSSSLGEGTTRSAKLIGRRKNGALKGGVSRVVPEWVLRTLNAPYRNALVGEE